MAESEHLADLAVLYPNPRTEVIAAITIEIGNLKVRQLNGFATATASFMHLIVAADYLAAITHHTDDVVAAVEIATGLSRDWLGDLDPDDMVRLTAAVFEVNLGFFGARLLPARKAAGERMAVLLAGLAGAPESPGLSGTDTALPKSES